MTPEEVQEKLVNGRFTSYDAVQLAMGLKKHVSWYIMKKLMPWHNTKPRGPTACQFTRSPLALSLIHNLLVQDSIELNSFQIGLNGDLSVCEISLDEEHVRVANRLIDAIIQIRIVTDDNVHLLSDLNAKRIQICLSNTNEPMQFNQNVEHLYMYNMTTEQALLACHLPNLKWFTCSGPSHVDLFCEIAAIGNKTLLSDTYCQGTPGTTLKKIIEMYLVHDTDSVMGLLLLNPCQRTFAHLATHIENVLKIDTIADVAKTYIILDLYLRKAPHLIVDAFWRWYNSYPNRSNPFLTDVFNNFKALTTVGGVML